MSRTAEEKIVCPYCQKELVIKTWSSVNVDLDPEEKEMIFSGKFFDFTCEHCQNIIHLFFSCLYHDMTHSFMIYLVGNEYEAEKAIQMFEDFSVLHSKDTIGYQVRVTTDPDEWREKAIIFDCGYDDRIIELIKLFYRVKVEEKFENLKTERVFFCPEKKQNGFVLEFHYDNGEPFTIDISDDVYQKVKVDYWNVIEQNNDNQFYVDTEWALNLLKQK